MPIDLRLLLSILLLAAAIGCSASRGSLDDDDDDDDAGDDDDATEPPNGPIPSYDGSCPEFVDGLNSGFESGGLARDLRIVLPEEPTGAPVLFAWHWLGGSADQILEWVGFEDLADEGVIVVAPESSGYPYEWRWDQESDDNIDAQLFEDTLACLYEQWDIDLDRVHTTGMSAGGLWSTWLIMYRSQWLASAAPLSGGVYAQWYSTPEATIPVMLVWGGPSDVYNGFSFDVSNEGFSSQLQEDGHFVVECEHSGGHTVPSGAAEFTWRFLEAHGRDQDDEPWAEGLPSDLPSYCAIP